MGFHEIDAGRLSRGSTTEPSRRERQAASRAPTGEGVDRHGYRAPPGRRAIGGVGTLAVFLAVLAASLLTWHRVDQRPPIRPLTVLMLPAEAPSDRREKPVAPPPKQLPQARPRLVPPRAPTFVPPQIVQLPVSAAAAPMAALPPPPALDAATAAPAVPAPPVESTPRHGPDKWENRVLARLARFRRYPEQAQRARIQGTATIRFRLDRMGHVLSSLLEESSGSATLDAAALDTLRRADPLPRIPPDRPDELELSVPVEFFIAR